MSYRVVVTREGDNWLADVSELEGAHTFSRSLFGLRRAVEDVIVLAADLPDDAVPDVIFEYDVDDEIVTNAAQLGRTRAELARQEAEAQAETAGAIDRLRAAGYSMRDAATLLGITPGRVSQVQRRGPRSVRTDKPYT